MCLFLNQIPGAANSKAASSSSVADGKSTNPEQYSAHSACVVEVNKKAGEFPRYGSRTPKAANSLSGDHQKQEQDKGIEDHMLHMWITCSNTQIKGIYHS